MLEYLHGSIKSCKETRKSELGRGEKDGSTTRTKDKVHTAGFADGGRDSKLNNTDSHQNPESKEMGCKLADVLILSTDVDFSFCSLELNNAFLF